jgi:hypothetical protein
MARKKFKTIAGYLRSMETDLWAQQARAKREGRSFLSDEEGQRQILNNLFGQMGIGTIAQDEKPLAAVVRLREGASEKHLKDLSACMKWLRQPQAHPTFVGATAETAGITYAGKRYTEAEFERLEQIARAKNITLDAAIANREA